MAAVLGKEAEILEELKGEALLGTEYEQLLPFLKAEDPAFRVYGADFVSTEDGTGIVHIAPAFGEDDYQLGRKHNLPVLQPVDKEGKFTAEVSPWAGRFVRDADDEITEYLKSRREAIPRRNGLPTPIPTVGGVIRPSSTTPVNPGILR